MNKAATSGECIACNGRVAVTAAACPHCGNPLRKDGSSTGGRILAILFWLAAGGVWASAQTVFLEIGALVLIVIGFQWLLLLRTSRPIAEMLRVSAPAAKSAMEAAIDASGAAVLALLLLFGGAACDDSSIPAGDGGADSSMDGQIGDAGADALACKAVPQCTATDSTGGHLCKKNNQPWKDSCGRYCVTDCDGTPKPAACFLPKFDPPYHCVASCDDCLP